MNKVQTEQKVRQNCKRIFWGSFLDRVINYERQMEIEGKRTVSKFRFRNLT